ncbi:hypothetical protein V5799_024579 [Amblyomma americanum]|uniref:Uncharacterized protein n=1 Tax=Amblyomma americanum TaxID=6943 RepID=A0AAQ4EBM3_AMBAM
MARLPARRSQPSGSHANPRSSSVPERKRARIVEFNSGHLKPFDYGFRREMVVREISTCSTGFHQSCVLVQHAKSLCAATLSGRRKARKPLCGCCESRHEWHQQVHKDAPGHHHLHRAASKKWPGHGVPQAYRRAPKPTVVPSGRRSQPPVAQNTTYAKVPADESAAHTEDTKGGEPEESSVAYESPRKSVSPSKLQQVTEECAVQPSVRHAVVLVNDILKPEVGEKAASDADRVLATPKACADSWQNATARELYRVLTRWQNASEQAAATATEDDLLGDPVIIKEGTEPLGASPALDPEGSSVLSSQSKP